jgi:enhancing lycopene biosynthesis protein 2
MEELSYAEFIESCRIERGRLIALVDAAAAQPLSSIAMPGGARACTDNATLAIKSALKEIEALIATHDEGSNL